MFIYKNPLNKDSMVKNLMKNIIGSFSPEKNERIFLCAHWDSRFVADHDTVMN